MGLIARRDFAAGAAAAAALAALGCSADDDGGAIALWFSYGGNNRKVLLELVDAFHAAQAEVRVRAVYQGDYFEGLAKLRTAAYAGATPTLSHVVGEVVPYLVAAEALEPLDDIGDDIVSDIVPALSQHGTYSGGPERIYALPFNRSVPIAYLNGGLFDELGLHAPRTWDELRDAARAARRIDGDGLVARWGFECPVDWWFWCALMGQAGGELFDADDAPLLGGEAGVQAVEFWRTLVRTDGTMRPPPGRDYNAWEKTNADFLAENAAMIWTSTAFIRYLEDNAAFSVRAAPLPALVRPSVPTGGTMWVMPRPRPGRPLDPARKRAGLAFLRFVMAPEQANHWAKGTGYLPCSLRGLELLEASGFFREHPNHRVAVDALAAARPWPWRPDLFRVQREIVQPRLEQAVLADGDPRALFDEAVALARKP